MDPPSTQLVRQLASLGLCSSGDLRRCRPRVRRLARDIPSFDTVWIDALVQNRAITTFQADLLSAQQPDSLTAGPFVLVDRLGSDGLFTDYRARRRDDRRPLLLTVVDQDPEAAGSALDRLHAVVDRLRGFSARSVGPIQEFAADNGRLVVASPWVEGANLQELLVRRGRFHPDVVIALLRQVAAGMAALEQRGAPHGDVRLRNIRVAPRGDAVLVRPGLLAALSPEISIHSRLPLDAYDTLAPERIGADCPANTRSDLYALGCALWHLLAGRPPFPHGDPLARLAAHQLRRVPDVRDWSPETPAPLALLIRQLTEPDPTNRPQSPQALADMCRLSLRRSRRRLSTFLQTRTIPAGPLRPPESQPAARGRWVAAASAALLLGSVCLVHAGARTELLEIAHRMSTRLSNDTPPGASQGDTPESAADRPHVDPSGLQPLPSQDAHGRLELAAAQAYEASEIAAVGELTIRCAGPDPAVIVVRDRPLRIWAQRAVLDNVVFRGVAPSESKRSGAADAALLVVDAQELALGHCLFHSDSPQPRPAIVWTALDPESAAPQRLLVRNSMFCGPGDALRVSSAVSSLELDNVLKSGGGSLLELQGEALESPRPLTAAMRQVTLRDADHFVRLKLQDGRRSLRSLEMMLQDCVFDIAQRGGALLQWEAPSLPDDWPRQFRLGGEGSLLRPATTIAGWRAGPREPVRLLEAEQLSIEGLQFAGFTFAGSDPVVPEDSLALGELGYRRTSRPPGIEPAALPHLPTGAYNSATGGGDGEGRQQATR